MARTESNMMPLGTVAPKFNLPDTVSGKELSFDAIKSDKGTVVMFICNHCPYVIHVQEEIVRMAKEYGEQGLSFVAISANDVVNYPEDAPDKMTEHARKYNFDFPYLYDESQEIAKAYQAACTPDFFVFDGQDKCVYRGRMDASTPGNGQVVTGEELRMALDDLVKNLPIDREQHPSIGCGIKWKA
ncbi:AhpC/TSA family protein [Reichenbachiella agariperforans]|uniref:AhpC/TSA family protein n=1 Tax=Reichenbachiella agariperforans TaxID=156994 RepID=A0A1M6QKM4_REIAG|nr:thioredoxin family protein [Reichenbachiella agariperforans]SHK20718.1 AhpC/TSA family protein [Reichenbachiella agariperforans]